MTTRDFNIITEIIAAEYVADPIGDFQLGLEWSRCRIAGKLAEYFEHTYGAGFDRDEFLAAAKVD